MSTEFGTCLGFAALCAVVAWLVTFSLWVSIVTFIVAVCLYFVVAVEEVFIRLQIGTQQAKLNSEKE